MNAKCSESKLHGTKIHDACNHNKTNFQENFSNLAILLSQNKSFAVHCAKKFASVGSKDLTAAENRTIKEAITSFIKATKHFD